MNKLREFLHLVFGLHPYKWKPITIKRENTEKRGFFDTYQKTTTSGQIGTCPLCGKTKVREVI